MDSSSSVDTREKTTKKRKFNDEDLSDSDDESSDENSAINDIHDNKNASTHGVEMWKTYKDEVSSSSSSEDSDDCDKNRNKNKTENVTSDSDSDSDSDGDKNSSDSDQINTKKHVKKADDVSYDSDSTVSAEVVTDILGDSPQRGVANANVDDGTTFIQRRAAGKSPDVGIKSSKNISNASATEKNMKNESDSKKHKTIVGKNLGNSKEEKGSYNDHPYNEGSWTQEEREGFYTGYQLYGNQWAKISKHIRTRSRRQVIDRAAYLFKNVPKQEEQEGGSPEKPAISKVALQIALDQTKCKETKSKEEMDNNMDLYYNEGSWTQEEREAFYTGYKLYGNQWAKVSAHIGTRSRRQVIDRAAYLFKNVPKQEELEGESPAKPAISKVALQIALDQTKCKEEKDNNMDLQYNEGSWTQEEREAFYTGYKVYGNQWTKVSAHIGTRSRRQVIDRAAYLFKRLPKEDTQEEEDPTTAKSTTPSISKVALQIALEQAQPNKFDNSQIPKTEGKWTKKEHEAFIQAHERYGDDYKKVAESVATRSARQCRDRAAYLFKRLPKLHNITSGNDNDDDGASQQHHDGNGGDHTTSHKLKMIEMKISPAVDRSEGQWTNKEKDAFRDGYKKFGENWTKISQHIGSRTARQVNDRFNYLNKRKKKQVGDDEGEKELDNEKVAAFDKEKEDGRSHVANDNHNQLDVIVCDQQEQGKKSKKRKSDPSTGTSSLLVPSAKTAAPADATRIPRPTKLKTTGNWTNEEHEAFLFAHNLYGNNWKKVSEHVGTRTAKQTRLHYLFKQKSLASKKKREEERALAMAAATSASGQIIAKAEVAGAGDENAAVSSSSSGGINSFAPAVYSSTHEPASPVLPTSPRDLSSKWTKKEHKAFFSAMKLFGKDNWEKVSGYLNTKTPQQCLERSKYLLTKNPKEIMEELVDENGTETDTQKISQTEPGHILSSVMDCMGNGNSNNIATDGKKWTNQEHEAFLIGYKLYHKNWQKVSEYIGTRSLRQTIDRANYLVKREREANRKASNISNSSNDISNSNSSNKKKTNPHVFPSNDFFLHKLLHEFTSSNQTFTNRNSFSDFNERKQPIVCQSNNSPTNTDCNNYNEEDDDRNKCDNDETSDEECNSNGNSNILESVAKGLQQRGYAGNNFDNQNDEKHEMHKNDITKGKKKKKITTLIDGKRVHIYVDDDENKGEKSNKKQKNNPSATDAKSSTSTMPLPPSGNNMSMKFPPPYLNNQHFHPNNNFLSPPNNTNMMQPPFMNKKGTVSPPPPYRSSSPYIPPPVHMRPPGIGLPRAPVRGPPHTPGRGPTHRPGRGPPSASGRGPPRAMGRGPPPPPHPSYRPPGPHYSSYPSPYLRPPPPHLRPPPPPHHLPMLPPHLRGRLPPPPPPGHMGYPYYNNYYCPYNLDDEYVYFPDLLPTVPSYPTGNKLRLIINSFVKEETEKPGINGEDQKQRNHGELDGGDTRDTVTLDVVKKETNTKNDDANTVTDAARGKNDKQTGENNNAAISEEKEALATKLDKSASSSAAFSCSCTNSPTTDAKNIASRESLRAIVTGLQLVPRFRRLPFQLDDDGVSDVGEDNECEDDDYEMDGGSFATSINKQHKQRDSLKILPSSASREKRIEAILSSSLPSSAAIHQNNIVGREVSHNTKITGFVIGGRKYRFDGKGDIVERNDDSIPVSEKTEISSFIIGGRRYQYDGNDLVPSDGRVCTSLEDKGNATINTTNLQCHPMKKVCQYDLNHKDQGSVEFQTLKSSSKRKRKAEIQEKPAQTPLDTAVVADGCSTPSTLPHVVHTDENDDNNDDVNLCDRNSTEHSNFRCSSSSRESKNEIRQSARNEELEDEMRVVRGKSHNVIDGRLKEMNKEKEDDVHTCSGSSHEGRGSRTTSGSFGIISQACTENLSGTPDGRTEDNIDKGSEKANDYLEDERKDQEFRTENSRSTESVKEKNEKGKESQIERGSVDDIPEDRTKENVEKIGSDVGGSNGNTCRAEDSETSQQHQANSSDERIELKGSGTVLDYHNCKKTLIGKSNDKRNDKYDNNMTSLQPQHNDNKADLGSCSEVKNSSSLTPSEPSLKGKQKGENASPWKAKRKVLGWQSH